MQTAKNRLLKTVKKYQHGDNWCKFISALFGTRLYRAKCSVLYPQFVRLRKIGVCESGVNAEADEKSLVSVSVLITEAKLFY